MQLIPAFLHIPKCGADYFLSKSWSLFVDFLMKSWTIERTNILIKAHRLIVTNNLGVPILTAIVYDPSSACKSLKRCYKNHENPNNKFVSYIKYEDFLKEVKISMLKIFSVIIEPEGLSLISDDFFKDLENDNKIKFKYITTLQHPFKMVESFFISVLKRSQETGETSHRSISTYIKSKNAPFGWLVKRLNGNDSGKLTKKAYLKAINVLDKVKIFNLSDIDSLILNTYAECHNIDANQLNIKYSEEKINRKKFDLDINNDIKNLFEKKARFDMEIYKRYCKSYAPGGI